MKTAIRFRDVFNALKTPKQGLAFLLAHQEEVKRRLESPAWAIFLDTMLKHEPPRTRRIIRRQLRLFRYLLNDDGNETDNETERSAR